MGLALQGVPSPRRVRPPLRAQRQMCEAGRGAASHFPRRCQAQSRLPMAYEVLSLGCWGHPPTLAWPQLFPEHRPHPCSRKNSSSAFPGGPHSTPTRPGSGETEAPLLRARPGHSAPPGGLLGQQGWRHHRCHSYLEGTGDGNGTFLNPVITSQERLRPRGPSQARMRLLALQTAAQSASSPAVTGLAVQGPNVPERAGRRTGSGGWAAWPWRGQRDGWDDVRGGWQGRAGAAVQQSVAAETGRPACPPLPGLRPSQKESPGQQPGVGALPPRLGTLRGINLVTLSPRGIRGRQCSQGKRGFSDR